MNGSSDIPVALLSSCCEALLRYTTFSVVLGNVMMLGESVCVDDAVGVLEKEARGDESDNG